MPIQSPHPEYAARLDVWRRCRDAYRGEDAVKARGETYLPKVDPGQSKAEYDAYKARALFYGAVARTVNGFVGAIARKPPEITLPALAKPLEDDATADGMRLSEFIKHCCVEVLVAGRGGVLVDFDDGQARACLALYGAEAIFSWGDPGGLRLMETVYEPKADDPYALEAVGQIRQLHMVDGAYTVTLWRKAKERSVGTDEWVVHDTLQPAIRGVRLTEIPFYWLSPMGATGQIEDPPMLGLVNVSLSHYRSSADLEHGRHFTGLPTLWISGAQQEAPVRVGAAAAITLPDPASRVGYAEFTGQGLGSLENALAEKQQMMAAMGAAVIAEEKAGVEAAETARIRSAAQGSLLMGIVTGVEETLDAALTFASAWMGAAGEAKVTLNREFFDIKMDPATLVGLVQSYQAGAITEAMFLYSLAQSDMLPPDTDIEAEAAKLATAKKAAAQAAAKQPAPKPAG